MTNKNGENDQPYNYPYKRCRLSAQRPQAIHQLQSVNKVRIKKPSLTPLHQFP